MYTKEAQSFLSKDVNQCYVSVSVQNGMFHV